MFFFFPVVNSVLLIYILAAIVPALFLMYYVYRMDTVEKEPGGLLASLFFRGIVAAFIAGLLERAGNALLSDFYPDQNSEVYTILFAYLVVAVVEEGCKFILCYTRTWRDPNFNCRYDGIVYMVFTSLGFAAIENVMYVFNYGLSVAVPRALLSIPGHMGFAVVAGAFYGRAKLCEADGWYGKKTFYLILSYLSAVFLHGFYDSCAMIGTTTANILFYAFVVFMYIFIIALIKHESRTDEYI